MSQTISKLTVRNRKGTEGRITTGANTELLIDGTPVKGITFLKIEIKPAKVAKITIEMIAEVDVEMAAQLQETDNKLPGWAKQEPGEKQLAVYTLSSLNAEKTITRK
jgi:hypothetical protein